MQGVFSRKGGAEMKREKLYLIAAFLFISVLGTVNHFVYEWTGRNVAAALFTPINESTWEHMKLLFFPALLAVLFMPSSIREHTPALPDALLLGTLIGTWSIPVLFYTYSGILGTNIAVIDILIFFVSVFLAVFTAWKLRDSSTVLEYRFIIRFFTVIMAVLFILFTFYPPDIGLFQNPLPPVS